MKKEPISAIEITPQAPPSTVAVERHGKTDIFTAQEPGHMKEGMHTIYTEGRHIDDQPEIVALDVPAALVPDVVEFIARLDGLVFDERSLMTCAGQLATFWKVPVELRDRMLERMPVTRRFAGHLDIDIFMVVPLEDGEMVVHHDGGLTKH